MGNTLRGKRSAKVMKINGETMKFKTPVYANEVVKDYPGHVVLESEAVKHFGIRAKPLEPQQELKPKRLYFLVELPKNKFEEQEKEPRRVRSGIHMTAKDRLESLMLSRRSVSDLSILKPTTMINSDNATATATTRLKLRLPKAEVEKLMKESKDEADAAARIVDFCMANTNKNNGGCGVVGGDGGAVIQQQAHWKAADRGVVKTGLKSREVCFISSSDPVFMADSLGFFSFQHSLINSLYVFHY